VRRDFCLILLGGFAACTSGGGPVDAGPPKDGGIVNFCSTLDDGGAIGATCSSLVVCGGNPISSDVQQCSINVICAAGACASAGGTANSETLALDITGITPFPSYLQIYLLAPQLVTSGSLSCSTLLDGIDAGMLNPNDVTAVNPLYASYEQSTGDGGTNMLNLTLNAAASGPGRVLYIEGYLDIGEPDGGALLLGRACTTFDNTTAGSTSATMDSLW
jgi:hypothetical protein